MSALLIELAFFDKDMLLCRGGVRCGSAKVVEHLDGVGGHQFELSSQFEEPACPVEIACRRDGTLLYEAALRVGVHTSDDWESVELGNVHTLTFRCREEDESRA
jgi:hypothetical protein